MGFAVCCSVAHIAVLGESARVLVRIRYGDQLLQHDVSRIRCIMSHIGKFPTELRTIAVGIERSRAELAVEFVFEI